MDQENGLQKFTDTQSKIAELMKKKKICVDDLNDFDLKDRELLGNHLTELMNKSYGDEEEKLLTQIDEIIPVETKNQIWEQNHVTITTAISEYIEDYGRMPAKNWIVKKTKLSRNTIYKHLKNFDSSPFYADEIQKFKFMADRVLSKVFKVAISGDTKAARLYFEVLGMMGGVNPVIRTQNNYLQINNTKLSQETIKLLSEDQLNQIETVLKSVLNGLAEKAQLQEPQAATSTK